MLACVLKNPEKTLLIDLPNENEIGNHNGRWRSPQWHVKRCSFSNRKNQFHNLTLQHRPPQFPPPWVLAFSLTTLHLSSLGPPPPTTPQSIPFRKTPTISNLWSANCSCNFPGQSLGGKVVGAVGEGVGSSLPNSPLGWLQPWQALGREGWQEGGQEGGRGRARRWVGLTLICWRRAVGGARSRASLSEFWQSPGWNCQARRGERWKVERRSWPQEQSLRKVNRRLLPAEPSSWPLPALVLLLLLGVRGGVIGCCWLARLLTNFASYLFLSLLLSVSLNLSPPGPFPPSADHGESGQQLSAAPGDGRLPLLEAVCRLRGQDRGPLSALCYGQLLAQPLPQVLLLPGAAGRHRHVLLHQEWHDSLQKRLH